MSDPLRTDSSRALEPVSEAERDIRERDAKRDAKIEQLLLAGLDHYFAARYEQAINVWTRALFFDRSHPRARAYIERARSALAERQRESEELLQNGLAAFGRGDTATARRLLQAAIDQGAPPDEAFAVLGRLDRLEPGQPGLKPRSVVAGGDVEHAAIADQPQPGRLSPVMAGVIVLAFVAAGLLVTTAWPLDWLALLHLQPQVPAAQTVPPFNEPAPELPRRGEMALDRARSLSAGGRLRDALEMLKRVRQTDPERADADRLKADIQKQLLALAGVPITADRDTSNLRLP